MPSGVNPRPANLPTAEQSQTELGMLLPPLPLTTVPFRGVGLLAELPTPESNRTGWPWTVETKIPSGSSWPKITVVTPSFEQGRFLEESIRSVLLQNYPNLEYIVMDGGSRDESAAVVEKYRPWLSFARSASDRGQGHAINLGFSLGSGDLLGWLNSDDLYLPGALFALAEAAKSSAAHFFYGDGVEFRDETGRGSVVIAPYVTARYRHFGGLIFSHSAFWRRSVHKPIWEAMRCNVDGELWQRLLPGRRMRYIPRPLGAVRLHPMTKTGNPLQRDAWAEDDAMIWAIHGRPPARRTLIRLEYRWVQRMAQAYRKAVYRHSRRDVLSACQWTDRAVTSP